MSWFSRISRFGSVHMVRSQDQNMSCGMSSIVMVNFKMKQDLMFAGMAAGAALQVSTLPFGSSIGNTLSRAAIDLAVKSEQEVIAIYEKVKGSKTDFNKFGSFPNLFPEVLARLGLGWWECAELGEEAIAQAIIDATDDGNPVIVVIAWDEPGPKGETFFHAVVVDETYEFFGTRYLCVCDPWDGELRLISCNPGNVVRYDGNYKPISTGNLFGGTSHKYPDHNNKGELDGRIVRLK